MTLNWQDPPQVRRGRPISPERQAVLADLRANPGRWALVAESVHSTSGVTWKRRYGVEVRTVSRRNQPGRVDLYVRWPES